MFDMLRSVRPIHRNQTGMFKQGSDLFTGAVNTYGERVAKRAENAALAKLMGTAQGGLNTAQSRNTLFKSMGKYPDLNTNDALESIGLFNRIGIAEGNLNMRDKEFTRDAVKWGVDAYGNPAGVNRDTKRVVRPDWGILTPEEITAAKSVGINNIEEYDDATNQVATEVSEVIPEPTGDTPSVVPGYSGSVEAQPGSEAYAQQFLAQADANPIDRAGSGQRTASLNTVPGSLPATKEGGFDYANWNEKAGGYTTGSMEVPNATGVTMDPDTGKYYQYGVQATPPKDIGSHTIENSDGTKTVIPINKKTQQPLNPQHVPLMKQEPKITWKPMTKHTNSGETKVNIGSGADGKLYVKGKDGNLVEIEDLNKATGTKPLADTKATAEQSKTADSTETGVGSLQRIKKAYDPEYVGPFDARAEGAKSLFGQGDIKFNEFQGNLRQMTNITRHELFGSALTPQEIAEWNKAAPVDTQHETEFVPKYNAFVDMSIDRANTAIKRYERNGDAKSVKRIRTIINDLKQTRLPFPAKQGYKVMYSPSTGNYKYQKDQ